MQAVSSAEWTHAQRRIHWITATLIVLVFPLGFLMVNTPMAELFLKFMLYQAHKTCGIIVFALTFVRALLRARCGRPVWEQSLSTGHRRVAAVVHAMLYGLLVIVPILGYLAAATAPSRVPTLFLGVINVPHIVATNPQWFAVLQPVHRLAAMILVLIAAGHGGVALFHHWRGRRILSAMWRGPDADIVRHQADGNR